MISVLQCVRDTFLTEYQVIVFDLFSFTHWKFKTSYKMASQTQGIPQLLAAEKKAADKVAEARKSE